jgi:hypothetical protein
MFTLRRQADIVTITAHYWTVRIDLTQIVTSGETMKNLLPVFALLLLISANALAGSEYDRCIREEKNLKEQEAGQCSGFRYILNPSACFATRKVLKEFTLGKCKKIGMAENVNSSAQTVIPEQKVSDTGRVNQKKAATEVPLQESTIEQLKAENSRLKAEIIRLKTENEQLRKTVQQPQPSLNQYP